VRRPVAHHQHLHSGWGIACNREEWSRRCILLASFVATSQLNFSILDADGFVDGNRPGGATLDLKRHWRQVCRAPESGRQRYGGPAIGELEIDFDRQKIALAPDLVRLFSNRLLKFVESELALFNYRSLIRPSISSS
jgi:hypothetical protein